MKTTAEPYTLNHALWSSVLQVLREHAYDYYNLNDLGTIEECTSQINAHLECYKVEDINRILGFNQSPTPPRENEMRGVAHVLH